MTAATAAQLTAESRKNAGKGAARALRREGKVPAVLYARGGESVGIALSAEALRMQYLKGRFRSRVIDLAVDGKTVKALPRDVQFHPVTDLIEHVDFQKVAPGEMLRVLVPVKFVGADKSPGIKRGGVLNAVRHEIEFLCAMEAIPHHIEADVSEMEIGQALHINDMKLPAGITPTIARNFTVATVAGRMAEVEESAAPTTAAVPTEADLAAIAAGTAAPGTPGAPAAAAAPAGAKPEAKKDEKK